MELKLKDRFYHKYLGICIVTEDSIDLTKTTESLNSVWIFSQELGIEIEVSDSFIVKEDPAAVRCIKSLLGEKKP